MTFQSKPMTRAQRYIRTLESQGRQLITLAPTRETVQLLDAMQAELGLSNRSEAVESIINQWKSQMT